MNTWRDIWRMIRTATIVAGSLLTFFVLIELIRAFQVLYSLHPIVGLIFVIVLLGACVYGALHFMGLYRRYPTVLIPPVKSEGCLTIDEARRHAIYVGRVMQRLAENTTLSEDLRRKIDGTHKTFSVLAGEGTDKDRLLNVAGQMEREVIEPAMVKLDEEALREERKCVRDVMIGVTLSPWHSVDLFVVIYRNLGMLLRIMQIYNTRAPIAEQGAILKDVLAIVATVNILNYSSKLALNLASWVPGVGRLADEIAQGLGAGLLTSVAGRAAVGRCRAYRGWSRVEQQESIRNNLQGFWNDIKLIFVEDVLVQLRLRMEAQCPEEVGKPDYMERLRQGIFKAVDQTASMIDLFKGAPATEPQSPQEPAGSSILDKAVDAAVAIGQGTKAAGKALGHGTMVVGAAIGHGTVSAGKAGGRWVKGVVGRLRRKKAESIDDGKGSGGQ